MEKEQFDTQAGYCRMLGHEVRFTYCRLVRDGLPCHKVLDCWYERIPIRAYVDQWYSAHEQSVMLSPPPGRLVTLIDLIQQASARQKQDGNSPAGSDGS